MKSAKAINFLSEARFFYWGEPWKHWEEVLQASKLLPSASNLLRNASKLLPSASNLLRNASKPLRNASKLLRSASIVLLTVYQSSRKRLSSVSLESKQLKPVKRKLQSL